MVLLCTAAVGFYSRFLIELWRECRPTSAGHWVSLRQEDTAGEVLQSEVETETSVRPVA